MVLYKYKVNNNKKTSRAPIATGKCTILQNRVSGICINWNKWIDVTLNKLCIKYSNSSGLNKEDVWNYKPDGNIVLYIVASLEVYFFEY